MSRGALTQELLELHNSIFQFAIQKSTSITKMPLFSIQAPGNIGIDTIDAPNLNITFESLPAELKDRLKNALSSGKISNKYPLNGNGNPLKPGLIDCFLEGLRQNYHLSVVTDPLNRYPLFLALAENHSKKIAEWLDTGTTSRSIQIIIQPEVMMGRLKSIGNWTWKSMSLPELCLEAYQGSQSEQEALERVRSSSFFNRDMSTMPTEADEILAEVDIFALALWLSLGNVYRIQDIRFEREPWKFSPDECSPFGIKFQLFWENSRENFQLQTFVRFNKHKRMIPNPINNDDYNRIIGWIAILSDNHKAIYSFNMICDGIRDIARSVGEQSFRRDRIARDGIFRVISGLEGLNSECKPSPKGYKINSRRIFIECWGKIWRRIISADPSNKYLSKAADIDLALKEIYDLRSNLAHSDPALMPSSLYTVKKACGELFSPGQYDPRSVGITIIMIVDELIEYFLTNSADLKDLLNGVKPS